MKRINQVPGEVTFLQAIKDFFAGYVEFRGRTTRAGYWWIRLIGIIISIAFLSMTISLFMYAAMEATQYYQYDNYSYEDYQAIGYDFLSTIFRYIPFFLIYGIGALALFLPNLSLGCRRLRDAGLTGRGIFVNYLMIFGLSFLMSFFYTANIYAYETVTYALLGLLCSGLIFIISIQLFVFTILPTDKLETQSSNKLIKFFFRERILEESDPFFTTEK
ncbi:DUF805 domain-containing protein [Enterococcus sp. AZ196]|uniref:DUF805 domain-containing protein n=1 Tax=Enterococcus sp. AZ196 TaxID=2774659 RepID=UPI003D2A473B